MPTKQRTLTLVRLRLHYELERNVTPGRLRRHNLQFTRRELPTDDRFVQFRGYPARAQTLRFPFAQFTERTRSDSTAEENSKGKITSAHWTKFSFNRGTARNIDRVESASRINEKQQRCTNVQFRDGGKKKKERNSILRFCERIKNTNGLFQKTFSLMDEIRNFFNIERNNGMTCRRDFVTARNIRHAYGRMKFIAQFFARVITRHITALSINYNACHKSCLHW